MFRFTLSLQGRELLTVEFGTPEPPSESVDGDGGDFAFGFGPPPPPVVQPVLRSNPIDNAPSRGRHTEE